MPSLEFLIGELNQGFRDFRFQVGELKADIKGLRVDIDEIKLFRAKVIGASVVVSILTSMLWSVGLLIAQKIWAK